MSRTVDYFEQKYNQAFARSNPDSIKEISGAIKVFTTYGEKSGATYKGITDLIAVTLNSMIGVGIGDTFENMMINREEPSYTCFRFAILQELRFVNPKTLITSAMLVNVESTLSPTQKDALEHKFVRQIRSPTTDVQKKFLGVIISLNINKFHLEAGNSGFASACFVVAKKLQLPNIAKHVWWKMIEAANFPGDLLGRTTSKYRKSVERSLLTRLISNSSSTRDRPPSYSEQPYFGEEEEPPPYQESCEPPPDYTA